MVNARLNDFNKKFVYTQTNPENIIAGTKNAIFFRQGHNFYFNPSGVSQDVWTKLNYRTVVIPPPSRAEIIKYKHHHEIWLKTTDGAFDKYGNLLPKTGWKLLSHNDAFATLREKTLHWIFPSPISSNSPGIDGNRSYDQNFFYANIGGIWYRTPIALFNYPGITGPEVPTMYTELPFVDPPRYLPIPTGSYDEPTITGDQTYDEDFFYIYTPVWRRAQLDTFAAPNKMTLF